MKKVFKKAVSLLLIAVMVLGASPLAGFIGLELPEINIFSAKAEAAVTSNTFGKNLTWTFDDSTNTLTISGSGNMQVVDVWAGYEYPWAKHSETAKTIVVEDGITSISRHAFINFISLEKISLPDTLKEVGGGTFDGCVKLKEISVPASVTFFDISFNSCDSLVSINVHPENTAYTSDNGILFNKNKTELIAYPPNHPNTHYDIPDSLETIDLYCGLSFAKNLKTVYVPSETVHLGNSPFGNCPKLEKITVSENNPSYFSDADGVLLSKNKEEFIRYPQGKAETEYRIPDTVTKLNNTSFTDSKNLKKVYIGANVKGMSANYAFEGCDNIVQFVVDEKNTSFSSDENGVIFTKDKITLYKYPSGRTATSYTVPYGVQRLSYDSFNNAKNLTSISFEDSDVFAVADKAFGGCSNISEINLPDSVAHAIDKNTFIDTAYYKDESNWENGVLYIGNCLVDTKKETVPENYAVRENTVCIANEAFTNAENLKEISLPDTLTHINSYAFRYSGLTKVALPSSLEHLGYGAFSDCKNLKSVDIDENVKIKYLYTRSFARCSSLEEITVPSSVGDIQYDAFTGCTNLKNVWFADESNLKSIGSNAFSTCISLEKINLPEGLTTIDYNAFYGCLNLKTITVPDTITSVGYSAFENTGYSINESNWEDGVLYIDSILYKADPKKCRGQYIIKDSTTCIATEAFINCSGLAYVEIPETVRGIGAYAFENCTDLEKVVFTGNSELTEILYKTFYICEKLNYINIPASVTKIESYAFYNANLYYFAFDENCKLESIGSEAFYYCNIPEINLPVTLKEIGNGAFRNCLTKSFSISPDNEYFTSDDSGALFNKDKTTLINYPKLNSNSSYTLPDEVTVVADYAFENARVQELIINPTSRLERIGERAFYGSGIRNGISFPEGLKQIGSEAFQSGRIPEFRIPASVEQISPTAFNYNVHLENIDVDGNNEHYLSENGVLFTKDKTNLLCYPPKKADVHYTIPESVTTIGNSAFYHCNSLESITIGKNVNSIGYYSFYACKTLKAIDIPDNVKSIGSDAFNGCSGLVTVKIGKGTSYIGSGVFSNCSSVTSFSVNPENEYYCNDRFGVLFDKAKTSLRCFPVGSSIKNYTVPDSVIYIFEDAFIGTMLASITIPESVTSIGYGAFYHSDRLDSYVYTTQNPDGSTSTVNKEPFYLTVNYLGSPSQWKKISISSSNNLLDSAIMNYAKEDGPTSIPGYNVISDPSTDVSLGYISKFHDGDVDIQVEKTFDEAAFDVITTELDVTDNIIYDIKMTLDGVETQPNGTVIVRIPLPDGYDPAKTFVYHVDTNTGKVENMKAEIETEYGKKYLVFETDHFSYYAVVELNIPQEETPEAPVSVSVAIRTPSQSTISYGDSIVLHADLSATLPSGYHVEWASSNDNFSWSADGETCTITPDKKGDTKFVVTVYDAQDNAISFDEQIMTSKAGFFDKIIAFFKKLFGLTKTIPQFYKNIF